MTLLICAFALGSGPRRMGKFLDWTSPGRIFTSLHQDSDESAIRLSAKPSKAWIREEGRLDITVKDQDEVETPAELKPEQESHTTEPTPEEESDTPPAQQRLLQAENAP
ncbi:unnamed protein product [Penicillium pancosmium]